jgi:glycosyl transferase family 87
MLDFFRDAPWLTRRRLAVYPKLFFSVYIVSAAVWLLRSKGLIDPAGHPIGADFIDPWSASWLTLHRAPSAVYDIARLWTVERSAVADSAVGFAGFHYPPVYLLIILPLALLPYAWSLLVWTVATFAAYLAVMWKIDPERDSLWLAIAFPGALVNLTNGQNGFLTLGLLGAALLTLERRPIVAGVMFGLMSYKPQYGLLVPIFLIATGRWRAIAAASVTVVVLAVLSFAMFGAQTWHAFFSSIAFTRQVVLEQGGSGFEKLQSAFAAARLWGFSVATAYAFQAAVSLAAAIVVIWIWRATANFDLHASALAIGVLLMTPYMMDYDLVILALPIAWIALEGRRSGFLAWEKSLLAFCWLLPLFARSLAGHAMIPIAPLAMLLLLADVARRALVAPAIVPLPSRAREKGVRG